MRCWMRQKNARTFRMCLADLTTISLEQRSHRWGKCLVLSATWRKESKALNHKRKPNNKQTTTIIQMILDLQASENVYLHHFPCQNPYIFIINKRVEWIYQQHKLTFPIYRTLIPWAWSASVNVWPSIGDTSRLQRSWMNFGSTTSVR